MANQALQRYMRLAQAKHRGSRQSYKTQLENCQILLAWERGDLSEGQASKALGLNRIESRTLLAKQSEAGANLAELLLRANPQAATP